MRRVAIILAGAAACAAEPSPVFVEDFECGAGLCGWKPEDPRGVAVVETIQPGEHGLHLPGANRVRRRLDLPLALGECPEARLVTDCHWGSDAAGDPWRELEAVLEGDAVVLRLSAQDYDLGFVPQAAPIPRPAGAIGAIVVEDVRGDCTVDAIRLYAPEEC